MISSKYNTIPVHCLLWVVFRQEGVNSRRRVNILTVVVIFLHDKQDCLSRYQGKQLCRIAFFIASRFVTGWVLIINLNLENVILQPDNIGFDVRGDVKIFDLGLAKELGCSKDNGDGTYQLTGDTGSPRYVAFVLRKVRCSGWYQKQFLWIKSYTAWSIHVWLLSR